MIKAVIFDCFGVIISDGLKQFMEELDKTNPEARQTINYYVRLANSGQIPESEYGKAVSEALNIPIEEWRSKIKSGEHKDPRVIEYIKSTRKNYKTALLSNLASKESMNRRFSEDELKELFDVIVISGEVGVQKPNPEIYQVTVERLGVDPNECVFIDDIERFCTAAKEVGMQAIWYKDFNQAKGELETLLAADSDN